MKRSYTSRLFSGRLYAEGMRRLLLPGIISLVLMTALQIMSTVGYPFNWRYIFYSGTMTINGVDLPGLITVILPGVILPFLFVTVAFGFLHRREGSDFTHSLSTSRSAQCLSLWLAAMTWTAVAAALSLLVTLLLDRIGMAEGFFVPSAGALVLAAEGILALLTAGASLLAVCLTGTRFAAAGVTAIILLLPRLWVGSFVYLIYAHLPVLGGSATAVLRLNLLADTLVGRMFFTMAGIQDFLGVDQIPATFLYTGGLGLLYTALGVLAYCRRKSEMAGRGAPNRFLQATYRISLALLFCAPACLILLTRTSWMAKAVTFYLLAVLVYFGFELLTTRRLKNLVKALPGLAVVAAINLLFIGGYRLVADRVLAFAPRAEEMISLRFEDEREWYAAGARDQDWIVHYLCQKTYPGDKTPRLKELVAERLRWEVNRQLYEPDPTGLYFSVEIETEGGTYSRRIRIGDPLLLLSDWVVTPPILRDIISDLPVAYRTGTTVTRFGDLEGEQARHLYLTFQLELAEADQEKTAKWIRAICLAKTEEAPYAPYQPEFGRVPVYVEVEEEGRIYSLFLPVPDFCTKTLLEYYTATGQGTAAFNQKLFIKGWDRIDYAVYNSATDSNEAEGVVTPDQGDMLLKLLNYMGEEGNYAGIYIDIRANWPDGTFTKRFPLYMNTGDFEKIFREYLNR